MVLLDQMGFGSAIVYHDCAATLEVIGEAGLAFGGADPEKDLAEKLSGLIGNSGERGKLRKAARERAEKIYSWEKVTDRYEEILKEMSARRRDRD